MAKRRAQEQPAGSPAWMSTFSDLMNLLLCFFVLLFSMSTVDAEKFQMVIASLQSSLSIMPAGSMSIGEGEMVGNGISQHRTIKQVFFFPFLFASKISTVNSRSKSSMGA